MTSKKIAVIGSGISGLVCIKECLAEGFQVICYEKQSVLGGLWRFSNTPDDRIASIMKSTIINSSKEMSAFSDFPPPAEYPNYMHNSKMIQYIELYADNFNLRPHIRFGCEVVEVLKCNNYESNGRWVVKVKDSAGLLAEELFDGVCVCNGHHVRPKKVDFPGLDTFKGNAIHTHKYKKPTGYEGKNVLVVGVGNSGGDVAVELSAIAEKVYLSTRSGCWVMSRVGPKGLPFDAYAIRRHFESLSHCFPPSAVNSYYERVLSQRFRHGIYNLKPKHSVKSQHPMINDILPDKILTGSVTVKNDVHCFHDHCVSFLGEEDVKYDIDEVILATGYVMDFPFLSKDVIEAKDNNCDLYKYVFPSQLRFPTLAFIGLVQPVGPLIPVAEIQARWFVELMAGRVQLPTEEEMVLEVDTRQRLNRKRYISGTRHTIEVEYMPYMDSIANEIKVKPNMGKIFLTDPRLFWACYTGPLLSYQYRLQGTRAWKGAREAILTYEDRVLEALRTKSQSCVYYAGGNSKFSSLLLFMAMCLLFSAFI